PTPTSGEGSFAAAIASHGGWTRSDCRFFADRLRQDLEPRMRNRSRPGRPAVEWIPKEGVAMASSLGSTATRTVG
ncbi:MAG: hypothetical protein ACK53L_07995, partial [Pirellulaceae bacterium]